eukprot:11438775-Alexandrium_andersonii.AAC.1
MSAHRAFAKAEPTAPRPKMRLPRPETAFGRTKAEKCWPKPKQCLPVVKLAPGLLQTPSNLL